MSGENAAKYENDPIFSHQEKKTEFMWRVPLKIKDDVETIYLYILASWDSIENINAGIQLTDIERAYIKTSADLLVEVTGDAEHTYISRSSKNIDVIYYASSNCSLRFTPYKRKLWRISINGKTEEINCPEDIQKYKKDVEQLYEKFNSWRDAYIKCGEEYTSYCMKWEG